LARQYGPEWEDALRRARESIGARTVQHRRRETFFGSRGGLASLTAASTPGPGVDWSNLPPEIVERIVLTLADQRPAAVVALYKTNTEAADIIASATHPFVRARDGRLDATGRIPLLDYARLAAAFGETDPVRLFLAMALCPLRAYAYIAIRQGAGQDSETYPIADVGLSFRALSRIPLADAVRIVAGLIGAIAGPQGGDSLADLIVRSDAIYPLSEDTGRSHSDVALARARIVGTLGTDAIEAIEETLDAYGEPMACQGDGSPYGVDVRRLGPEAANEVARIALDEIVRTGMESTDGAPDIVPEACVRAENYSPYAVRLADLWSGPLVLAVGDRCRRWTLAGRFESAPVDQAMHRIGAL
jgi:hypothetical protein